MKTRNTIRGRKIKSENGQTILPLKEEDWAKYSMQQRPGCLRALSSALRGLRPNGFSGWSGRSDRVSSGANFAWRLRPLALRLASLQAAGAHYGCYSAPLHSHPRLSRMALQPTSHWRKRCMQYFALRVFTPYLSSSGVN